MKIIERKNFDLLLRGLQKAGYATLGPVVRNEVILYDEIAVSADLPIGWTDDVEAGVYRAKKTNAPNLFGYTLGPQSWKKFLYPPKTRLFAVRRQGKILKIENGAAARNKKDAPVERYAFIGVRSCEMHAIALQDKLFLSGPYEDPLYRQRREAAFIVAVQCGHASKTCFCESMKTGPEVKEGYDLLLTEILEKDRHYFLVGAGSARGTDILNGIPNTDASENEKTLFDKAIRSSRGDMGRVVHNVKRLPKKLAESIDSPIWADIAKRCLTCANCTLVCPTCFCSTVEETVDLTQSNAERCRRWDSCFTMDFAKVAGGNFRASASARYRQWLSHKFSYWVDQFGASGCVGCGRCITWCPVRIDVTRELDRIQSNSQPEHQSA